jgi:hypothetical protein
MVRRFELIVQFLKVAQQPGMYPTVSICANSATNFVLTWMTQRISRNYLPNGVHC